MDKAAPLYGYALHMPYMDTLTRQLPPRGQGGRRRVWEAESAFASLLLLRPHPFLRVSHATRHATLRRASPRTPRAAYTIALSHTHTHLFVVIRPCPTHVLSVIDSLSRRRSPPRNAQFPPARMFGVAFKFYAAGVRASGMESRNDLVMSTKIFFSILSEITSVAVPSHLRVFFFQNSKFIF